MTPRTALPALTVLIAAPALAQTIAQVTPSSAQRSDRVVVIGSGFGAAQGSSSLEIDGVPAIVTFWSSTRIRAQVAEGTPLGPGEVRVIAGGSSNPVAFEVLPRQGADGRILWQRRIDHYYSLARPAIASDGTIYATGIGGPLYAVTPAGAVEWVIQNANGSRPAAVATDGTVYLVGAGGTISAASPDGDILWSYIAPGNAGGVFVGPNLGPDGKIYAVTQEETSQNTDFGAFALNPDGTLAWSHSGGYNHRRIPYGWEIAFGDGQAYFTTGQGNPINGNHGVHALDLDSGDERWLRVGVGDPQADIAGGVSWLGAIDGNHIGSFDSQGNQRWSIAYNEFLGQPGGYAVTPGGVSYYCTSTFTTLAAIEPNGAVRWQFRDFNHLQSIRGATPDGERFIGVGFPTDNSGPKLQLWDGANGSVLWEQRVPFEDGVWMVPQWDGDFSPDGRVFYITLAGNNYADDPWSYLVAIDVSESGPCPADFNTDGQVNTLDVLSFLNAWSAGDPAADFNADGSINTLDVLAFLNAWSAGC